MDERWLPKTRKGRLFHLGEECTEVLFHLCKIGRFGMLTQWPADGTTNAQKLLAELQDLKTAIARVEPEIREMAKATGRSPPVVAAGGTDPDEQDPYIEGGGWL